MFNSVVWLWFIEQTFRLLLFYHIVLYYVFCLTVLLLILNFKKFLLNTNFIGFVIYFFNFNVLFNFSIQYLTFVFN